MKNKFMKCSVDSCDRKHQAKNYCDMHYKRFRRMGSYVGRVKSYCKVEGCDRQVNGFGYCVMHYCRVRKNGDSGIVGRIRGIHGEGTISVYGYKIMQVGNRRIPEHRYIMEQYIGRKLNRNEVIHHVNENKLDNRIENLVLMSNEKHTSLHSNKYRYCQVNNCDNNNFGHGFCQKHYRKYKKFIKDNNIELNTLEEKLSVI